ncbi:hypothetical protein P1P75_39665 [Streptomyces sp. ID05-39B]|nr:hypothetical protein [Streptomyces sp. ID05-39B]MDX3532350.1 hypothetical protein [Streptomyces sp. ID05-39B]
MHDAIEDLAATVGVLPSYRTPYHRGYGPPRPEHHTSHSAAP